MDSLIYLNFLFEKLDMASPATRFFLIKYFCRYGHFESVTVGVKGLVEQLGINDRVVTSSLKFLGDNGYLRFDKLHGARGHPRRMISAGEKLKTLFAQWRGLDQRAIHSSFVEDLLRIKPHESKYEGMSNSARLLLMVLYVHADSFGVVNRLGSSEIMALTGFSRVQLRGHLRRLRIQEHIQLYIPGAAIKGVKGKLKSTIVLSRSNSDSGEVKLKGMLSITSVVFDELKQWILLAHALKAIYPQATKLLDISPGEESHWLSVYHISDDNFEKVVGAADFFYWIKEVNSQKFKRICTFICNIVAELVLEKWFDNSKGSLVTHVKNRISQDLTGFYTLQQKKCVVLLFSWMVRTLLKEIEKAFESEKQIEMLKNISECSLHLTYGPYVALFYRLKNDQVEETLD
ncbi:MAG TPA: hypothetical protein VL987_10270 [Cellvibrio sp.]|nr:hypothetical protein [Cellvibrio sp.]